MCQTNSWKNLEYIEALNTIVARRSDSLVLSFYLDEFKDFPSFILKLEEFRNCKCLPNAPCSKHIEESERINANS